MQHRRTNPQAALGLLCAALAMLPAAAQAQTALVFVAPAPADDGQEVLTAFEAAHADALSMEVLREKLLGTAMPSQADDADLEAQLETARRQESNFDTESAIALRHGILRAFDAQPRPSENARAIAAEALSDLVSSLYSSGDDTQKNRAQALAREFWRRFADHGQAHGQNNPRHSPEVRALFAQTQSDLAAEETITLTVISPPGELISEGRHLGKTQGERTLELPAGRYRIWFRDGAGLGLPHIVKLAPGQGSMRLEMAVAVDRCVDIDALLRWRCPEDPKMLAALAKRLGAQTLWLSNGDDLTLVHFDDDGAGKHRTPAYLRALPLGVGQGVNGDPLRAGVVAGITLGLGAFHLYARSEHQKAFQSGGTGEKDARLLANLSLGAFITAIIAGSVDGYLQD